MHSTLYYHAIIVRLEMFFGIRDDEKRETDASHSLRTPTLTMKLTAAVKVLGWIAFFADQKHFISNVNENHARLRPFRVPVDSTLQHVVHSSEQISHALRSVEQREQDDTLIPWDRIQSEGHARVAKGIYLHYQTYGNPKSTQKIIMIIGMHTSKEYWFDMIRALLEHRHAKLPHILIFDNRVVGESYYADHEITEEERKSIVYSSSLMAQDTLKVMDHVGWEKAHVMGVRWVSIVIWQLAV